MSMNMEVYREEKVVDRVKQSAAKECDINRIIKQAQQSGLALPAPGHVGYGYMDCTGIGDYQAALDTVIAAEDAYYRLPAILRERLGNDPGRVLAELDRGYDSEYAQIMIDCGLLKPRPAEAAPKEAAPKEAAPKEEDNPSKS